MGEAEQNWVPTSASRILVVDDEIGIVRLVARILEDQGYTVDKATSGEDALEQLGQKAFDLVITDLHMPGMDGLSLAGHCQRMHPDISVIILTAHGTIQSAVQAIKQGISEYLVKPFKIEELTTKVRTCLKERRGLPLRKDTLLRPLIELSRILSQTAGLAQTVERIVDLLARTFAPVTSIEMLMFGAASDGDLILAHRGTTPEELGYARFARAEVEALARSDTPWQVSQSEGTGESSTAQQTAACLTVPLLSGGQVAGVLTVVREAWDSTEADAQLLQVFAYQMGVAILQSQTRQRLVETFRDLERATLSTVESLFAALETYDPATHHHSERVARYAYQFGQHLGMAGPSLETLRIAGLLHDIGKIGIGEGTIRKNGSLDDSERERVMLHPVMGERILSGIEAFRQVTPLVLYHHERFDGKGYPAQLVGEDIPLGARIIALVDAFDSMIADRPYRTAMPAEQALAAIRADSGTHFDSRLVDAWCRLWPKLNERVDLPALQ